MFLAFKEMRRAKARFGLLMGAIGLLVFLILFQQSLQNGLLTGFVGGIRNQSAPVLVFSVDGRRNIQGSVITPPLEQAIRATKGIGSAGRIGQGTFTVTAGGELRDASIIGYDDAALGAPRTLVKGRYAKSLDEAVAPESDAANGFDVGDRVVLTPGDRTITVVGLARDVQLNVTPTLYGIYDTYVAAVKARNPDALTPLPNVIALAPAAGVSAADLVRAVNTANPEADALVRSDAANKAPGVSQVRQSFQVIFLLYGLVVPFVTGLFFLIITFQKAGSLTLLRAIGAPSRKLVSALLLQVVVVIGVGLLIGIGAYAPISVQRLGGISLRFETGAVVFWSITLMLFGLLSALVSANRVLKIDPIGATTGAQVGG